MNPLEDVAFVQDEFDQWFADILRREWYKIVREVDQKRAKIVDGIAKRFTGLGITDSQVRDVLQRIGLVSKNPKEWTDPDIMACVKELRSGTKPMIIAANKADLCRDISILDRVESVAIPCSAETELLLRKASGAGMIKYSPGDGDFAVREGVNPSPPQQKALDLARSVFSKIPSTGIQKILDTAVFESLGYIVAYPVEDETKLTDKNGRILPDAKLLPPGSTARDLAGLVHADIAKGFLHAIDCKTRQRIGGSHVLKDGDVVKVVSTLGRG